MYRRPKFLEILLEIRRQMALEADYDVDLFAELARSGRRAANADSPKTTSKQLDKTQENSVANGTGAEKLIF